MVVSVSVLVVLISVLVVLISVLVVLISVLVVLISVLVVSVSVLVVLISVLVVSVIVVCIAYLEPFSSTNLSLYNPTCSFPLFKMKLVVMCTHTHVPTETKNNAIVYLEALSKQHWL